MTFRDLQPGDRFLTHSSYGLLCLKILPVRLDVFEYRNAVELHTGRLLAVEPGADVTRIRE